VTLLELGPKLKLEGIATAFADDTDSPVLVQIRGVTVMFTETVDSGVESKATLKSTSELVDLVLLYAKIVKLSALTERDRQQLVRKDFFVAFTADRVMVWPLPSSV